MPVAHVPSVEDIKKLMAEREAEARRKVDEQRQKERETEEGRRLELATREEEIKSLRKDREKLQTELAKVKDRSKNQTTEMRSLLDRLVKEYDLEPAEELMRMVKETRPIMGRDGRPQLDDNGKEIHVPALEDKLRAEILLRLLEFRMPKLRSSETKGGSDGTINLTIKQYTVTTGGAIRPAQVTLEAQG